MQCTSSEVGLVWRTVCCGTVENPLFWEGGFWKEVLSNIKLTAGAEARQPKEKGYSGYIEQEKKWHKMKKRRTFYLNCKQFCITRGYSVRITEG